MQTITGNFAEAKIFTDDIENYALAQIKNILDNGISYGSKVRIMPDVHPGTVGPIGLTMTIKDSVIPSLLGVDIGCGMLICEVNAKNIEFTRLDKEIQKKIPAGFAIRKEPHASATLDVLTDLRCFDHIDQRKAALSLGTLGGGNHFIEIDKSKDKTYIVIHTGSRHLGKEVAEYYMKAGRSSMVPYEMTTLRGKLMDDYINDAIVVSRYASLNRQIILKEILKAMKWKAVRSFESMHNFLTRLDDGTLLLRKGASSALEGEDVIIPVNMRDGVIIGKGLGNPDWNCSAPHGSGRRLSRSEVKEHYTVSAFKQDMKGIYSTCVGADTLDESPAAYRNIDDILMNINETVEVTDILKPVYNFKAGNKR